MWDFSHFCCTECKCSISTLVRGGTHIPINTLWLTNFECLCTFGLLLFIFFTRFVRKTQKKKEIHHHTRIHRLVALHSNHRACKNFNKLGLYIWRTVFSYGRNAKKCTGTHFSDDAKSLLNQKANQMSLLLLPFACYLIHYCSDLLPHVTVVQLLQGIMM